jgi:hypothetical protein
LVGKSTAAFSSDGRWKRTAGGDGRASLAHESTGGPHRGRHGCGPLTVRDCCVSRDVDAATAMAQDSIAAAKPPWTAVPILFR